MKPISLSDKKKFSHSECRLRLCLLCKSKKKNLFEITDTLEQLINQYGTYDKNNEQLPKALCGSCKNKLYVNKRSPDTYPISIPEYSKFKSKMNTRANHDNSCTCELCKTVRDDSAFNFSKNSSNMIKKKPNAKYRCSECLSIIGKGKPHTCNKKQLFNNFNSLDQKQKEQFASQVIKEKLIDQSNENIDSISLTRVHGKPMSVNLSKSKKENEMMISAESISKISTNFGLSTNTTLGIAQSLRSSTRKRKLFEPNLKEKLQNFNHSLDSYFDITKCQLISKKLEKIVKTEEYIVYCKDVQQLIDDVKEVRKVDEALIKIGADSGGNFLKITLSIQSLDDELIHLNETKRQKYNDAVDLKRFKDSGVNKLFLIGLTEFSEENHHNISVLWNLLQLKDFEGKITADLKLLNIFIGLMTHSSSYPCTWCIAHKDDLKTLGILRTIGSCIDNFEAWQKRGGKKEDCKNFKCCSNIPIISSEKEKQVTELVPPPELHLMMGVVNALFNNMVKKFENLSEIWAKKCDVSREVLYGNVGFAGNASKKLLNKADVLRELCTSTNNFECMKYVKCFEAFKHVVDSCFTTELKEGYVKKIQIFKKSYLDLEINVTPKVHAVFFHVEDFCKQNDKGLGFHSEQAVESSHADFKKVWKKYKVRKSNSNYAERLFKAVCEYNSKHI